MTPPRLRDERARLPIPRSERVYEGRVWNIRSEDVDLGDSGVVTREFMEHTGAVAILALNEADEVLLLRQYRHPVQSYLWELPAGLLDIPGEPWLTAARREFAEEADLEAQTWHTLVDIYTSPGGSDEFIRIYLARNLRPVPPEQRHVREAEEADLVPVWVPLGEAVQRVFAGDLHNAPAALGILAAHAGREQKWANLRPADAEFDRKVARGQGAAG